MKTMFKSPEHASSVQEIYRFISLKKKQKYYYLLNSVHEVLHMVMNKN